MATVQVRNVPEEVHRIYRTRAAAAGMSLQEYLLSELQRNARLRSPSELIAEVEGRIQIEGQDGLVHASSATLVRADRAGH